MELKQIVIDVLENGGIEMQTAFFESEVYTKYPSEILNHFNSVGITLEHMDRFGGEGKGDRYYSVYSFEKDSEKVYVKFNGWYSSYDGLEYADYTGYRFVNPKEQTVTVYI